MTSNNNNVVNIAILVSGKGSNLTALFNESQKSTSYFKIKIVITNNPNSPGILLAESLGLKTATIKFNQATETKAEFENKITNTLKANMIELVCLAGFMLILSKQFTKTWEIINIHPSLLPKFKGLDTHSRAIAAKESMHGCSVHKVNDKIDEGEVIAQMAIPISNHDSSEVLKNKVLEKENLIYPYVLQNFAKNKLNK